MYIKSTKRTIAILLAVVMLLSLFVGCKKTEPAPENTPEVNTAMKLEHAYIENELPISIGGYASNFAYFDGRLYFVRNTDNAGGEYAEGPVVSTQQIVSTDLTGADEQIFYELSSSYDETEDMMKGSNTYLSAFAISPDGSINVIEQTTTYDNTNPNNSIYEQSYVLITLGMDGTELSKLDLTDAIGTDGYLDRLMTGDDGNLYISGYGFMLVLDGKTGEQIMKHNENNYITGMFRARDGLLYLAVQDNMGNGVTFKTADLATKTMKTAYTYEGSKYFYNTLGGNGEYDIYFVYQSDIFGLKFETMQEAIVVSGVNSDIDLMNANLVAETDDGFIISTYDYSNGDTSLARLIANPDATIGDKVILTLGTANGTYSIMSEIRRFNKESTTARIMVTDYSEFNDYMNGTGYEGITQLDNDILAGRMPDILLMTGLQASKYAAKGVLEDLYPYLDADSTLGRDTIFPNILKMCEYKGELSHIITGIGILTLAGKQSIFGERNSITIDELSAIADAHPDATVLGSDITADTWMLYTTLLGLDRFIDWETGTCSFDSPDFIATLNFAKRFGNVEPDYMNMTNEDWMLRNQKMTEGLLNGGILLNMATFYQDVRTVRTVDAMFGEASAFVGFPAPEGMSGHAVIPQIDFAISATSKNKDAAWEFISRYLQPDYASDDNWTGVLSANREAFENAAALEMLPLSERDLSKGLQVMITTGNSSYGTMVYSEEEYDNFMKNMESNGMLSVAAYGAYPLTAEEVDRARNVIESAAFAIAMNEQIQSIMTEETQPFLAGAKTAEETAKIIQSRIQLYVSETR